MVRGQGVVVLAFVTTMSTLLIGIVSAQSSGCTTAIISLAPCLNYITGNASVPSSSCCSQLARIVQAQPACLCSVLNGGASSFGITVNQTRALAMPGACKVQTPPVSECNNGAKSPTTSPPATPATPESPANPAPATPSVISPPTTEGGSKATPTAQDTTSDAAAAQSLSTLIVSILFLAVCVSFTKL